MNKFDDEIVVKMKRIEIRASKLNWRCGFSEDNIMSLVDHHHMTTNSQYHLPVQQ